MKDNDFPVLEHRVKYATVSLHGAGGETTYAMVMALYPEVLKKAHEELDRVIGTERMTRLSDQPNFLPHDTAPS
ncbi:hypothetical protein C8Q78DRAFT_1082999 [Trametes maxima]|nr:hypothetical protein C8Q78DRAFT_1082999 [Trametes maxima]